MSEPIIEISGLWHTYMIGTPYERQALQDVTATIFEGETVALVGPTGSGKSTLLQHMNGIYLPHRGSVRVLGRDLSSPKTDLRTLRREVGLVLQNPGQQVFERFVGDDVAFGPRLAGLKGRQLTDRVQWAMEQVGLDFDEFRDRPTFALSGGERRKAGLAGVIALKPRILLLDEPTAGLDPAAHDELLSRLGSLASQGISLVIATHSMNDVAEFADRVIVLGGGAIVRDGTVREVLGGTSDVAQLGLELPVAAQLVRDLAGLGITLPGGALSIAEAERAVLGHFGAG